MRIVFLVLVFIHALIHLLGFLKGYDLKDIKALTLPISKPIGLLWLVAGSMLIIYGIMYITHSKYSWLLGIMAVIISQILIILFWEDAKFGTIPNILILVVSMMSYSDFQFHKMVHLETAFLLNKISLSKEGKKVMTENDVENLPHPVKVWLYHSGAVGKPFTKSAKVVQKAQMKMKPGQKKWMHATAVQYSAVEVPSFIWVVKAKMNSFLNFQGRDKFVEGHGEMLIKLNSLFTIVNEPGDKLDEGSIQRYLGEMVWFPSLALSPYITWEELSETSAKATINYKGTQGSGTFYFNKSGELIKFSALRFKENTSDAKRYWWVLEVEDYKIFEGIKVPSIMKATWQMENTDWTWLKLEIIDIQYNYM